ncbi:endo alpha-1,4 polygalactosaminidase [Roseivirga sp. UBA1976]|uniref:endo alpha-1,4 polygalactosaminidase n=1 Tax=Roseivirga sp. UBA1976 TaxID=1947386 RepID=UPI00257AEA2C|nr:endo alpha-1,4 polygalactosaminidase [Roseivirga sp. UBA1976]MEC7755464.1 endo alpha-1,4 polygalactosaminidase [Bacteroidota bacterium]|tara:strand:+ start:15643 stop:16650 length:1008 start_codon:yes stop_codon:yes gene_type:complete
MKKTVSILPIIFSLLGVFHTSETWNNSGAARPTSDHTDYRQEMRNFVRNLSVYAKQQNADFLIIPQNGQELATSSGDASGVPYLDYLNAIDATGREDLFYGYSKDNKPTPSADQQFMLNLCLLFEKNGVEVLTTDYCHSKSKVNKSYRQNKRNDFISFAAHRRNLDEIPSYPSCVFNENSRDILRISEAKNFLYLLNYSNFRTKTALIEALAKTNYDLLILDLFFHDKPLSSGDLEKLKTKANGGKRLVVSYMSIGEAEDYRYYWQSEWQVGSPAWIKAENPDWEGNYKVNYWDKGWQQIIYGNDSSYLKKIIDAGFDGAYLDIIDAFEYFENHH